MESTGTIVQYLSSHVMRHRLLNLFTTMNQKVYDVSNEMEFFNVLNQLEYNVDSIIIDVDSYQDNGASILTRVRSKNRYAPVIVISSITKRAFYVESMLRGATDFILKPFEDSLLVKKVFDQLKGKEDENSLEIITFDLSTYLKGEIRKAEKGQYPLSLMFSTYFYTGSEKLNKVGKQNTYQIVYNAIKALFWDTDIFIRFGTNYYIGVFPFCDDANTQIISRKISERFFQLQKEHVELSKFKMLTIFNSFPTDTHDPNEILPLLIKKVREQLPNEQINPIT